MKNYIYGVLLLITLGLIVPVTLPAQNKGKNKTQAKKSMRKEVSKVDIHARITDTEGNPIRNAAVISGEGAYVTYTDEQGNFSLSVRRDARIIIEAFGYEDAMVNLLTGSFPKELMLEKEALFAAKEDQVNRADGGITMQRDLVGTGGSIAGSALSTYPDMLLSNALQGRIAGLTSIPTLGNVGNNTSSLFIRGQHTKGGNQAIVVIDGIERPLDNLIAEEIEKIELLKDPTTKILYGPRAANGVLWITTKRGEVNRRTIKASIEAGITQMTRLPDYVDAYEYAQLYNEARRNDGRPDFYSAQQLEGYKNSTGVNDLLYPNVDYYKEFLQNQNLYKNAVVEVNGGDTEVRYAVVLGYAGSLGFENVGDVPDLNRFNLRGNIDIRVTDYLSLTGGLSGRVSDKNYSSMTSADIFSAMSTHRPNEYPFTINPASIGVAVDSTGTPAFGASLKQAKNLYGDLLYGGFTNERTLNSQANLGMTFTLDRLLKGLKASAFLSFDNYDYFKKGQRNIYPTYSVNPYMTSAGVLDTLVTQMRKRELQTDQSRMDESTLRSSSWRVNASYENQFGLHALSAVLAYNYARSESESPAAASTGVQKVVQDVANANYTMRLNYAYNNKYIAEFDLACMGSNRFDDGNKFFTSPAFGGAWILSNEDFLKNNRQINFLKLKASYGILGYDGNTDFLLYNAAWEDGGLAQLGEQNKTDASHVTNMIRMASPGLKWEKSKELNVGIEALFLQNRLFAEIDYFHENRSDIIGYKSSDFQNYIGAFHGYTNMGEVNNQGIDASVNWTDKAGNLTYNIGLNFLWSKNELVDWDQISYPDAYRNMLGQPTDVLVGYQALGLFGKDVPLEGHPLQTFGPYQNGDIAYADLNGDNVVDERDRIVLGNSFARTHWGLNIDLHYKQWGLYLLGVAETGVDTWTNNNYYWNKAEDKYSAITRDRYHAVNNPEGTYPRLTSTAGENNFVNSSFWLKNTSFFRLKNVELSFTLPNKSYSAIFKDIKFFARGTNLFVISDVKELDPEQLNAGVNNYPIYRTLTGGVSVRF